MALETRIVRTTLLSLVLLANYARSQEMTQAPAISTDRPDVTESSIVVPKRSLQFENGITWTNDHGDRSLDFTETLVRFGLTTRTELRLLIPNYLEDVSGYTASGFSDIAVGAKRQLGPLWGHFDLSVIAAVSLPTGANRISSHGFDPFIKFPWSKDLAKGWSLGGMQSFFWNAEAGRRNLIWEPTLMAEKELLGSWSVFVEYAGFGTCEKLSGYAHEKLTHLPHARKLFCHRVTLLICRSECPLPGPVSDSCASRCTPSAWMIIVFLSLNLKQDWAEPRFGQRSL